MNAELLYENGVPLVIIPESKTDEFNKYVHSFGISCSIQYGGFCYDNVFEFLEDENVLRLKSIVERFSLNEQAVLGEGPWIRINATSPGTRMFDSYVGEQTHQDNGLDILVVADKAVPNALKEGAQLYHSKMMPRSSWPTPTR